MKCKKKKRKGNPLQMCLSESMDMWDVDAHQNHVVNNKKAEKLQRIFPTQSIMTAWWHCKQSTSRKSKGRDGTVLFFPRFLPDTWKLRKKINSDILIVLSWFVANSLHLLLEIYSRPIPTVEIKFIWSDSSKGSGSHWLGGNIILWPIYPISVPTDGENKLLQSDREQRMFGYRSGG